MAYWLISSGTSEEPHDRDDWQDRRRALTQQEYRAIITLVLDGNGRGL